MKPTAVDRQDADYETCLQVRIERIRVVADGEILSEFLAAQATEKAKRPYTPFLPPLKNNCKVGRAFEGQLVTSNGQRSSFLDGLHNIVYESFKGGYDYDELPLALRCDRLANQRHGREKKSVENATDLYHALLSGEHLLHPSQRVGKGSGKVPTQAFVTARKKMIAALRDVEEEDGEYLGVESCTAGTDADATIVTTSSPLSAVHSFEDVNEAAVIPWITASPVGCSRKAGVTGLARREQLQARSQKARRRTTYTSGGFMTSDTKDAESTVVCDEMQRELDMACSVVLSADMEMRKAHTANSGPICEAETDPIPFVDCETKTGVGMATASSCWYTKDSMTHKGYMPGCAGIQDTCRGVVPSFGQGD